MNEKLLLVDVSSQFFRAYYAIRELKTSEGFPTNALYGFLSMTVKLLNTYEPSYMVFCLDPKGGSFRNEMDENYKANRSEMPEDLAKQLPYIFKLTEAMGIPQMKKDNYEADDLIGSLAHWGEKEGFEEVIIVSGDKDFSQLINEKILMHDPMRNKKYDVDAVVKKYDIRPDQFIDYLAMVGDSSDNIPGVKGVGAKGAAKLLNEYESLDGVYENIEDIKGATQKKLKEGKESAYKSKDLVKIVTDLDLAKSKSDVAMKSVDVDSLRPLLQELEFESFMKNFKEQTEEDSNSQDNARQVTEIKTTKDFKERFKEVDSLHLVSTDRGEYLCTEEEVFTLPHAPEDLKKIGKFLTEKKIKVSGFDIKPFLKKLEVKDCQIQDDVQLMAYCLSSEPWTLKSAALEYCKTEVTDFFGGYDYKDVYFDLLKTLKKEISGEAKDLYESVEKPLFNVLLKMESRGVLLDKDYLDDFSKELEEKISGLTERAHTLVDKKFNLASPKQLSKILFEDIGLKPIKKTKTGYSTNTDVLEKLKSEHELPELIIEYRELSKLKSTYVDALPKLIHPDTQRVHTTYNQALTTTGRLSSINPNLQNIPIRTEEGRRVREAFVPKQGSVFLSADYSQIELRILAHISDDKALKEAFKNNQDVHSKTASEIFDVQIDEVTDQQRRTAKAVNFGIAYGQGPYGLAETLGISRKEAKEIIERYFDRFSGVKKYIDETKEEARKNGYVKTLSGRTRVIRELSSSNKQLQSFGERAAVNAPMQGTASDIIKMAMIEVEQSVDAELLLQVHDELILEADKDKIDEVTQKVKEIMESVFELKVPLVVNAVSGMNWNEAH